MHKKLLPTFLAFLSMVAVACQPTPTTSEPAVSENSVPSVGNIVPYGEPETREIDTTIETVSNCLGNNHSKEPSRAASSTHVVEWQYGNEYGLGFTFGEGIVPGGMNLQSSFVNTFGQGFMDQLTYTEGWQLFAHEGKVNTITLLWYEDWQPAYVDVTYADGHSERVELKYRTRIFSKIFREDEVFCDGYVPPAPEQSHQGGEGASQQLIEPTSQPASTQLTKCELISRDLPQTIETVRSHFSLPGGERNFRLIYEGCGATATGFVFEGNTEFELQVPAGGCIDSYSGAYFSDPPATESSGGLRAYSGLVRATGVTYRIGGCDLKP